jgi:hypothetical protein
MANRLQLKRGSGAPGSIFYEGEPVLDLNDSALYVGNSGATGTGAGTSIANAETFLASLQILNRATTANAGSINLYEDADNGTSKVRLIAPASLTSDLTLTLPGVDGSASQVLATDGSGNLSFIDAVASLDIAGDVGTDSVSLLDNTLTFAGTSQEIVTTVTDNQVQIGLPDDVLVGGALTVTGAVDLNGGFSANSAIVEDLTDNRVLIAGIGGEIEDDANLTFDGTTFAVTGNATVDDVRIDGSKIDTTSGDLTLDSTGGTVIIDDNASVTGSLTVSGDLRVVGTAVTFETEIVKVEDRLIELGLVSGAAPSSSTTWDTGIAFNYYATSAKKSALIWLNNSFMVAASEISESADTGTADPQISISAYAPLVSNGLYIGGITAGDEVINSSKEAVNLVFDGGTYS